MHIVLRLSFALFVQCISLRKKSVFKKIIHDATNPTFKDMGAVTQPLIFCRRHKSFSWYRVNHHKKD